MCIKSDAKNSQQYQKWLFSEANRDGTARMPSLLFRCFSLFLPHLRTLAQEKRSQNCLRFGTGGQSLCLYQLLSRNIIFSPSLTTAAREKKNSGELICSRYQLALLGFWTRFYVYWIWLRGSASYVIIKLIELAIKLYKEFWNELNRPFYQYGGHIEIYCFK